MGTAGSCTGHPRRPGVRPGALSKGSPRSVKSVITPHPEDPRGWGWGLQSDPRMLTWGSPCGPVSPGAWNVRCMLNACLPGAGRCEPCAEAGNGACDKTRRLWVLWVLTLGGGSSVSRWPLLVGRMPGAPVAASVRAAHTFLCVAPHASPARDPPRTPAPGLPERLCPLCRAPRVPRGHLSLEAPSAGD